MAREQLSSCPASDQRDQTVKDRFQNEFIHIFSFFFLMKNLLRRSRAAILKYAYKVTWLLRRKVHIGLLIYSRTFQNSAFYAVFKPQIE